VSARANRRPDWRARLTDYLEAWETRPFAYGTADCWIFALGGAEAVTGIDYLGAVRGYDSREAGLALLRETTGRRSHIDFVYRTFTKLPSIWHAMPGDIAAIDTHDGLGLAVVQGESLYAMTEADGRLLVPLQFARGTYAVGSKDRT
jgi:hypothetical protein